MRIDTGTIENFATLDADALRKFIESFEYDDHAAEIRRLKEANDKLCSENKEWKDKYRDTLSAEARAAEERKEADAKKDQLIADLTREKTVNGHKAQFAAAGYSAELAEKAANALADNDAKTLFEVQTAFLAEHDKGIRVENMNKTPMPAAGAAGGAVDFGKKAEEAMAAGDYSAAAYYTRLQAEEGAPQ